MLDISAEISIEFQGCVNMITDESLESLAKNCPQMELLDITGCTNITAKGLELLSLYLPKMYQ
jgi:hypothetical protein